MLHYLAALGNSLYAKYAQIWFKSMIELKNDHPDVSGMDTMHVACHNDRTWKEYRLMMDEVLI